MLKIFNRNNNSASNRRHQRFPCMVVATLTLPVKNFSIEGIITEVSESGINFRNASNFILNRNGTEISIDLAGETHMGKIVASRKTGYGIQFNKALNDQALNYVMQTRGQTSFK